MENNSSLNQYYQFIVLYVLMWSEQLIGTMKYSSYYDRHLFLFLLNYAATSSCLALLQRKGACAAHNHLALATRVLKLFTPFACTTLSYSRFQSTVVLGKKEFFRSSVLLWVTTYGLSLCLAYLLTCLLYTSPSPRDLSTSRMPSSA